MVLSRFSVVVLLSALLWAVSGVSTQAVTKISFLSRPVDDAFDEIVERFNEEYAGQYEVDLNYAAATPEVIDRALLEKATGSPPDLLYQVYTLDMVMTGLAADLTPYIERDRAWVDDFLPAALGSYELNGKIYGLPLGVYATYGVAYNPDAIAESGLGRPEDGWNWDEFVDYSKRLTRDTSGDGVPDRWAMVFQDDHTWWDGLLLQNGSTSYDWNRRTWLPDRERALEALEYYVSLMNSHSVAPRELRSSASREAFASGHSAMWVDQQSPMGRFRTQFNFDLAATHLPENRSRQTRLKSWGVYLVETGNQAKMDATWEFIKFMLEPEQNMLFLRARGDFPARQSTLRSDLYRSYLEELGILDLYQGFWMQEIERYGSSWVFPPARPEFLGTVRSLTNQVLDGELSPVNLIEQIRQTVDPVTSEILEKLGM